MLTRITTGAAVRQMNTDIQNAMRGLTTMQRQLSTGRRINQMSDGPTDATTSLSQRAQLRRNEQFDRNSANAQTWLRTADLALTNVSDGLAKVRDLLVQSRSAALDGPARTAIANQIRQVRSALLGDANITVGERPVFGGTTASTTAYDSAGGYQGDTGAISLQVSASLEMTVNATGPAVFGTFDGVTPLNGDVFQVLDALATAVAANDQAVLVNATGYVDNAVSRISQVQVVLGSRAAQLEDLQTQNLNRSIELKSSISKLEDIDFAETMIALRSKEAAYQAALQVTAKVLQPTLMDFLR